MVHPRAPEGAADLRRARADHGLSLRAAAKEIGVTRGVIREAEAGRRPQPQNARRIADFFGVTVSALWPDENAPAPLVAAGGTTESPQEAFDATAR